jgi:type IV pilus assembly protein PilQ
VTSPTAALGAKAKGSSDAAKQFTGHPVSLDFQGVDLRAVLRTFGEITGLNLVIDEKVEGRVDVALRDVPWDQALDVILRANKLGYTVEGTIVRIAPLSVLADEEAARRKLAEEIAQSGELVFVTRTLNYAKAGQVEPLLKSALSSRGRTAVDPRTNTLIIYDLPEYMNKVATLITTLDQPEMQVEIEARIIQTTTRFARELGIKWGFLGSVAPELGNTTGLAFPNSGSLFGAAGGLTGNTGFVAPPPGSQPASTGVNLGVNNPYGGVGLTLGAINGSFRLAAELSALEDQGKVRSLLTPRVVTQNNIKATITRGQEIPYSTITSSASTGGALLVPTVQFRTAALVLTVTPRITNANTVILEVDVDNGSPGEEQVNGNRAINTQRAQTTVLVADGATTVIGGIQGSENFNIERRVPGLWKLPWLGHLFRYDNKEENTEEILIFITPRILRVPAPAAPAMPTAAPQL